MDQNEKEEKLQVAMSDLSVIRQTMERSRVQMNLLSRLFLIYGGVQLILMSVFSLWDYFSTVPVSVGYKVAWGFLWGYHLVYAVIAVFYLKWRYELRRTDNRNTLYLYDSWGYILFVAPAMWIISSLICLALPDIVSMDDRILIMMLVGFIEYLMFFTGLAVTGFLLDSLDWKILSVLFICVYVLSFILTAGLSNPALSAVDLVAQWFSVQMIWALICPAISIILGIWFRYKGSRKIKSTNG